mmetsp:Transcript_3312/g.9469  ORF Transcript_3312/g.9469 Transcript_3312/m.9469 type:complete len:232 (-) Transcript_3312:102-797(-)
MALNCHQVASSDVYISDGVLSSRTGETLKVAIDSQPVVGVSSGWSNDILRALQFVRVAPTSATTVANGPFMYTEVTGFSRILPRASDGVASSSALLLETGMGRMAVDGTGSLTAATGTLGTASLMDLADRLSSGSRRDSGSSSSCEAYKNRRWRWNCPNRRSGRRASKCNNIASAGLSPYGSGYMCVASVQISSSGGYRTCNSVKNGVADMCNLDDNCGCLTASYDIVGNC